MGNLVVISGPSGVGKGTIVKEIQKIYASKQEKLYLSISCTTRKIREGEQDGVNYYFISEEEFLKKVKQHEFLEYNQYGTGKYYGTPKDKIVEHLNLGYDVILEIDVNGYRQVKENYANCIGVFIMPPSIDDLKKRLLNRGTENEELINIRLKTADEEILQRNIYNYQLVNEEGKVAEVSEKLYKIMKKTII